MIENVVVKSVTDTGKTWQTKDGKELSISQVELEDGRSGTTMSGKVQVGPNKLEVNTNAYGLNFKYVDEGHTRPTFTPRNDDLIVRQVAIKAAVEMACSGTLEANKSIYAQADDIVAWVMQK